MIDISPLRADLATRISNIEKECFSDPWSERVIRSAFSYPNAVSFGAFEDGHLIGYYFASYILQEAELMNLCVLPAYRRRGLGTRLLTHLKQVLTQKQAEMIFLEVRAGNTEAQNLYKKVGFLEVGLRRGYYENNGEDAILMRCDL